MLVDSMTFNEHVVAAIAIASEARTESSNRTGPHQPPEVNAEQNAAARDFSLAITHLEDAATRYNSGRYHQKGVWQCSDPDKV